MNDELRFPPEVEAALIKSGATIANAIASRITNEDHDREGFAEVNHPRRKHAFES